MRHQRHQILQGDSLLLLPGLQIEPVGMVCTDPPYSSGGMFRSDRAGRSTGEKYIEGGSTVRVLPDFHGDSRDQRGFLAWCSIWLAHCWQLAAPDAVLAVFTDWRQLPTLTDAVQAGGWVWRGLVPWSKTAGARPQRGWVRGQCEYIVLGTKSAPPRADEQGAPCLDGLFEWPVPREKKHQTEKPAEVISWLLQLAKPGCLVLDPFAGSGTTGVAALLSGRSFVGIEIGEEYSTVCRRRCAAAEQAGVQDVLL